MSLDAPGTAKIALCESFRWKWVMKLFPVGSQVS